jgi:hypothetical protein
MRWSHLSRRGPAVLISGAAAVAVVAGAAYATTTSGGRPVSTACVSSFDQELYVATTCAAGDHRVTIGSGAPRRGKTGPQGRTGPRGPKGLNGSRGAIGPGGAAGAAGLQGAAGPQGVAGATGPRGADGTNGSPGTNGAIGPRGADGATGQPGVPGIPGIPGNPGQPGAVGATGRPGADGATGPQGDTGPRGADGAGAFVTANNPGPFGTTGASAADLGGPSVTVDVPSSGLVEIYAGATSVGTGGNSDVFLYEDGSPMGQVMCDGFTAGLMIGNDPSSITSTTGFGPTNSAGSGCGTNGAGVPSTLTVNAGPGTHTFKLEYAITGGSFSTTFSNVFLSVAPRA